MINPTLPNSHPVNHIRTQIEFYTRDPVRISLIQGIFRGLNRLAGTNLGPPSTSPFALEVEPGMDLLNYTIRIAEFSRCSNATLVISTIYLARCALNNSSDYEITARTVHKLLLTAILIGYKFHEDKIISNKYMSEIGGISLCELNDLEHRFLSDIKFKLFVDIDEYQFYENIIRMLGSDPTMRYLRVDLESPYRQYRLPVQPTRSFVCLFETRLPPAPPPKRAIK
jgi:hypothetical protein